MVDALGREECSAKEVSAKALSTNRGGTSWGSIANIRVLSSITRPAPLSQRDALRQSMAPIWLPRHPPISAMPDGGEGGCPEDPALTRTRSFKHAPFPRPSRAWPYYIFTVKGSSQPPPPNPIPNSLSLSHCLLYPPPLCLPFLHPSP